MTARTNEELALSLDDLDYMLGIETGQQDPQKRFKTALENAEGLSLMARDLCPAFHKPVAAIHMHLLLQDYVGQLSIDFPKAPFENMIAALPELEKSIYEQMNSDAFLAGPFVHLYAGVVAVAQKYDIPYVPSDFRAEDMLMKIDAIMKDFNGAGSFDPLPGETEAFADLMAIMKPQAYDRKL